MTYRVARSGQVFGPYSEVEVRQYIASGNIGPADLVQPDDTGGWVPVTSLFPQGNAPYSPVPPVTGPRVLYPDPPNLPWWMLLLLGVVTSGVFFVIWDIVQASWLKRISRNSTAILFYIGVAIMYLVKLPAFWSTEGFSVLHGFHFHGPGLGVVGTVVSISARFVFRKELLEHFNAQEGIGLRLNGFLTLILGGIYFQFHFNKINELKKATNLSVPAI